MLTQTAAYWRKKYEEERAARERAEKDLAERTGHLQAVEDERDTALARVKELEPWEKRYDKLNGQYEWQAEQLMMEYDRRVAAETALASARPLIQEAASYLPNSQRCYDWLTSHPAPVAEKSESDRAYTERNRLVAALARHYPSGLRQTAIKGWDPAWNGCCFIDTPEGQMSWHYHEDDACLFAGLPAYEKPWDGHTTPEKYERLARLAPVAAPCAGCAELNKACSMLRRMLGDAPLAKLIEEIESFLDKHPGTS